MNIKTAVLTGLFLATASGTAFAAANPLSVHVLNIQNGLPSPDVTVTLERKEGSQWVELSEAVTNEQGRVSALYPDGQDLVEGTYRVVFETGDWFETQNTASFFPEIPVVFTMDGALEHYHVPLLLSPYGYSTYRGN